MNLKDKERLSVDVTDVTIGVFGFELNLQIIHKFVWKTLSCQEENFKLEAE